MMRTKPIGTKLRPPPLPRFAVMRPALVRRLDHATRARVTLMVAPPGYGKSVVLAQWAAGAPDRHVAWFEVDSRDNNAIQFARSLAASIACVYPDVAAVALERVGSDGESLGDDFVAALLADLALVPELVLVFDNFEVLRNGALLADISTLVEHAPPQIHFVFSGRSDAGVGLQRLRVLGELAEVRQNDLAMDEADAAELFRRVAPVNLDHESLRVLVHRTEGWAAGLQLAALSLQGNGDAGEFVRTFSGDDRNVADYLTDEVLQRQPADVRRFLVETSVLTRLSGPLCDAVTGRTDSQRLLEAFDRHGMLIVRLDDKRRWFRYHPLLRDLLRYELEATERDRARALRRRAAEWHLARGDVEPAAQYLIANEDWPALIDLINAHGRAMFDAGEPTVVQEWLAAVPVEVRQERFDVALTWLVLLIITGRSVAAAEEATRLSATPNLTPWQEAAVMTARAALIQGYDRPERSREAAERVLECLDRIRPDDEPVDAIGLTSVPFLRASAQLSQGRATHYLGESDDARTHLRAAIATSESVYAVWLVHALGSLALIEADDGDLRESATLTGRAFDVTAGGSFPANHPAYADTYLALARACRDRDELERAAVALDEAHHRIRRNRRLVLLSFHTVEAARLALAQGRVHEGLDLVARSYTDGRPAAPPVVAAALVAAEAHLHLAAGDVDQAAAILDAHDGLLTRDVAVANAAVAVARNDVAAARKAVADIDERCPRGRVLAGLWAAVVADLDRDGRSATEMMAGALHEAQAQGMVRDFIDAGAPALRVVRRVYHREPTPFLRRIVDREIAPATPVPRVKGLIEQLSDRELIVLRYLPSRLSNPEIAQNLYVSVNTLKTHLKHIYRKLDVNSRSEAIARAESLGLI